MYTDTHFTLNFAYDQLQKISLVISQAFESTKVYRLYISVRENGGLTLGRSTVETLYYGHVTLSTQLMKPK